jgi:hypothetical protein
MPMFTESSALGPGGPSPKPRSQSIMRAGGDELHGEVEAWR